MTLYFLPGGIVAYYDDATVLWQESDDTLPMFHVMVQDDPPHRTCIRPLHLVRWLEHLTTHCIPVQVMGGDPEAEPPE